MPFVAYTNTPGYMPDTADELPTFDTAREAWQHHVAEVEQAWDEHPADTNGACIEAHTTLHNLDQSRPGSFTALTPGYDGDHDLGVAYCVDEV